MKSTDKGNNDVKSGTRICMVSLLNGQEFSCSVPRNANGSYLLNHIRQLLDIIEFDYFGLSFEDSAHQKYWLEGEKSIKKQLKNSPWQFNFAVKFYPADPSQLAEDIVRYYMVLQLRDCIVSGRLPCSFVTHALLGSYVVQSELGDYDGDSMKNNYVEGFQFAPNQTSKLEESVMELHKKRTGLTPEQAETGFLENVKKLHFYGVDLHPVKDSENVDLVLGVCWNGLRIYRDQTQINRFAWPRILKICYSRTKFYIRIRQVDEKCNESIIGFKLVNHREAKKLWKASVEHHTFFRLTKPDVPKSKVLRTGSKFRYSGLTQHQTRQSVASANRKYSPKITRTASRKSPSFAGSVTAKRAGKSTTSSEEGISPPALPKKEHVVTSETVTLTEEIIEVKEVKPIPVETETTVTETVVIVQEVETAPACASSSSSLSSFSDGGSDVLTKHQKKVYKLKPKTVARDGTEETKGEFLEKAHPGSTASSDWDIRLKSSPAKSKQTEDSKSVDGRYITQGDELVTDSLELADHREQHAKTEEVTVVTTVVIESQVTEMKSNKKERDNDSSSTSSEEEVDFKEEIVYKPLNEEPLPDFVSAEERKESVNSSSDSSSSEDQEEVKNVEDDLEHETTIHILETTIIENNHADAYEERSVPKQADDIAHEDASNNLTASHSSLSSKSSSKSSFSSGTEEVDLENPPDVEERKSPVSVDDDQNENNNNNEQGDKIPDLQKEEDAADVVIVLPQHKITTVETKSVRVEEAMIPRTEYEVRKVALTADQDNNVTEKAPRSSSSSSSSSSSDSEDDREYAEEGDSLVVNGFKKPPIVETETVVVEPVEDDEPELTNEPPVVQTETKTITYESTIQKPEVTFLSSDLSGDTQLLSSQTITAETMSSVTTTHITKTVVGSVSETRVEKSVVITSDGESNLHQAMAEAILDTQENNPNVNITKVVVQEEKVIGHP